MNEPTPFWILVRHFVMRMFSGEEEEGVESMSLGLGVVLAMLASPGAFACLFLLDKYSTLLQFLRGQRHFDFYKASAGDEYFFVVLSMTITGLVMVLRWNRLFPDRRDFWNLAVLPIPVYQVFLANFAALAGIALVFAIDINAVSSLLFPMFVTLSDGSFPAFLRIASGHVAAVFSASLFSFFAVFALVGLLMLVLPAKLFRPISVMVRMLLVVGLLTEFLSNLFVQLLSGRLPGQAKDYVRFLPSFWFLGVYERVAHTATPLMRHLGGVALEALAASLLISTAAYALCYRRHFLRLAESFDSLVSSQRAKRFQLPERLNRLLFRSPFEQAVIQFSVKVLLRSERHVMILGGYLGIGLVLVAQTAADRDLLSVPLLISFFLITGLRFVFDVPAALNANWAFRFCLTDSHPSAASIARKFMLLAVLPWQLVLFAPPAITAINLALSVLGIEFVLWGFCKIPFTYAAHPDARQMAARIIGSLLALIVLVPLLAGIEARLLGNHWWLVLVGVLLGVVFFEVSRHKRAQPTGERTLTFEERPKSAFELLKLA